MKRFLLIFLIPLIFCVSKASASIDVEAPSLGNPYDPTISSSEIWDAFTEGSFEVAWSLLKDHAYQKARQTLMDEKKITVLVAKAADALREIIEDPDKTEKEKGAEVAQIIAKSIEPYHINETSALNLSVQHSIEFGTSMISWEDKTQYKTCSTSFCTTKWTTVIRCENGTCWDELVSSTTCTYKEDYLAQVPDYYIYRVVDGQDKLITFISGFQKIQEGGSFTLGSGFSWEGLAKETFNFWKDMPNITNVSNRPFWWDLHSDVRNIGEVLEYKIVAKNGRFKWGHCGHDNTWETRIIVDGDGDGKMDYIPETEYQKLFGKYYGWLIPVITLSN